MDAEQNTIERLEKELESHRKRIAELAERAEQCDRAREECEISEKACMEAESQLGRERNRLEFRVRERTMELTAANQALKEEIAERLRIEKALVDSEAMYREVVQNANSIILRMDRRGNILFINDFALRFFGYSLDEVLGRNVVGTIVPATAKSGKDLTAMIRDIGERPEMFAANENENIRRNGELVWVAWTNRAILDHSGSVTEILCIGNDITDIKRAEEQLLKARDELELRVKERTAELTNINKELQAEISERMAIEKELRDSKEQAELYVDLMGHDINNMNQVAMGYLEIARDSLKLDRDSMPLIQKPLDMLIRSSKLISNVRKVQQVRKGDLPAEKVDIGPLLDDVVKQYSHLPGREVNIHYAPAHDMYVIANWLLKDVFENIVGNAIKHSSGPLAIDVTVTKEEKKKKAYYKIAIADTGPGIPDDLKEKLFDRHGTSKHNGHGLGLYLVGTLVDSFHGLVWAEDRERGQPEKGARFVVMLPVAEPP